MTFPFGRTGRDVFEQSAGLRSPATVDTRGLHGTVLEDAVLGSLRAMRDSAQRDAAVNDLRVYTGGAHEPRATEAFLSLDPGRNLEELETTCRTAFGATEHTVVINKAEKWFPAVAPAVADLTSELQQHIPDRLLHAELLYFIGDSRFTPFGIHIDDAADALHFNFGPSPRRISLWEPERFEALTGGRRSYYQTQRLSDHGQHHSVQRGDMFFLPATRYYHVAENHGFSVSMVLTLIQYAPERLVRRAMRSRAFEMKPQAREIGLPGELLQQVHDGQTVAPSAAGGPSIDVTEAVADYVLRIRSNCGFRATPQRVAVPSLKGRTVRRVAPFPVILQEGHDGTIKIFARGTLISCPDQPEIRRLIESLNGDEVIEAESCAGSQRAQLILTKLVGISAVEVR
ncbi:hypothetical protein [Streptomyces sp. L2]|uniref:hypothetical protein n=1 Tax=Streptomyces sp. L2 TaxID=2162665 RepID=UPI001010B36D|nr:hypothetical protein [Streptomyces sp. L2]